MPCAWIPSKGDNCAHMAETNLHAAFVEVIDKMRTPSDPLLVYVLPCTAVHIRDRPAPHYLQSSLCDYKSSFAGQSTSPTPLKSHLFTPS